MTLRSGDSTSSERLPKTRTAKGLVWLRLAPQDLRIKSVQGSAVELLGFAPGDWQEADFITDRLDPRDRTTGRELLHSNTDTAQAAVAELRMIRSDGNVVWVQMCCLPRDGLGDDMRVSLLNIDQQVSTERALSQAVETMRDVLVTTSQEISQPANAISDYGGLLERHLSTQEDGLGSEYALGIREAVERMKQLSDTLQRVGRKAAPSPGRGPVTSGGR
ncbi:MAG: PAS domain-containing protein [Paracoccaceae bacterium]